MESQNGRLEGCGRGSYQKWLGSIVARQGGRSVRQVEDVAACRAWRSTVGHSGGGASGWPWRRLALRVEVGLKTAATYRWRQGRRG